MGPSCGSCRFGDRVEVRVDDESDPEDRVLCRRFPPTMVPLDGRVLQVVPEMLPSQRCGEWST